MTTLASMTILAINGSRKTILGAGLLLLAAPASWAQFQVHEVHAENPGDSFGADMAIADDLDGDGVADLWIGAPKTDFGAPNAGSAYAISGATGAQIFRVDGSVQGELFGTSVDSIGDLNSDGVGDLLVGAPFNPGTVNFSGAVFVFSGVDGAQLLYIAGTDPFGLLGISVAGAGDVDGDGIPDIIAGAPVEDSNGTDSGSVYVFSGANGTIAAHRFGDSADDEMGSSVCALGDLDGDGRAEYAGGAPRDDNTGTDSGSIRVWSSATGLPLFSADGNSAGDAFGSSMANVGDLNGDGKHDLVVGAPYDDLGGVDAGTARGVSGNMGATLFTGVGAPGDLVGDAVAAAGDVTGDGTPDFLVGGRGGNVAKLHSGVLGTFIDFVLPPTGASAWGASVAGGLDIDGDGRAEFVVADELSSVGGAVVTYSDHSLLGSAYCSGDGSAAGCPCGNFGGAGEGCANSGGSGALLAAEGTASVTSDDLLMSAQNLVAGQPALLFAGLNQVQSGNGALFGDGLRCAGGSVKRLGVELPNGTGLATWGPGLAPLGAWSAGDTRRFQVWYRDPSSSPCGGVFNLSNGFEVNFVQ
jgi:FG-GAP repeat/FG-GAP-like repeat